MLLSRDVIELSVGTPEAVKASGSLQVGIDARHELVYPPSLLAQVVQSSNQSINQSINQPTNQ